MVLSQICKEFGCLPSKALNEVNNDPDRWVLRILPVRNLVRAGQIWNQAVADKTTNKLPMGDYWLNKYKQIMMECAAEDREAQARWEADQRRTDGG